MRYQSGPRSTGKKFPGPAEHQDDSDAQNKGKPGNAAFKGGEQGFISLMLEKVEEINYNTKKYRFALPEKDDVSGLHIACAYDGPRDGWLTDVVVAALLTKYKGPEMEKV